MKQILMLVALVAMQYAAATIVNSNPKTPALSMSPWTSDAVGSTSSTASGAGAQTVNGTIYTVQTGSWYASVSATNGSSGATLWTTRTWNSVTWMSVKASIVVIATDNYFAGLNSATGAVNWNVSIVSGYSFSATTPAIWGNDEDCILAMVSTGTYNSKLYHFLPFSATGTPEIMWNSSSLSSSISSYYSATGPSVLAVMNGSTVLIQPYSNVFMSLNLSNVSNAVLVYYSASGSYPGLVTSTPSIINNTVYFFTSSAINAYDMNNAGARTRFPITFGTNTISITSVQKYNNGSNIGFAFIGSNSSSGSDSTTAYGNCNIFTTDLWGNVTGAAGLVYVRSSTYYAEYDCTVIDFGPSEVYVQDYTQNIYRYTYGATGFDWQTSAVARSSGTWSCGSGSTNGQYVNGKLYYAGTSCFNGSAGIVGWTVQINTMTGAYETLLPTPLANSLPVAFLYDGTSFGGSVVQYGQAYRNGWYYPYLISRVVAAGAQTGSWLAGGLMINFPVVYQEKVYLFSATTVYCFGLQNGSLMWSQSVASTISGTVNAVIADGNLFVPTASTSRNLYVFDLFNAVPNTMITIPSTVTGCPSSTDAPTVFVSDPAKPYVYFSANTGQCIVQFTKAITTAIGAPVTSTYAQNPPVLSGEYAYFNDYSGNMYYQQIAAFSSVLPLMRGASLAASATSSDPSPVSVYNGGVYTASTGSLSRFGTKTLVKDYVASLSSLNDDIPPLTLFKQVYAVLTNGSFASFPMLAPLLSKTVTPNWVISPNMGTLGQPVWTNYGVFVFATSQGVFAVNYLFGSVIWKITQDSQNRTLNCAGAIATRAGVAYVQCNSTLYLIDIPKGQIYLRAATVQGSTYVIDTSNQLNLNIMTIAGGQIASFNNLTTRLYAPSSLPAPVDGSESWLDIIKNNKIWIAAVIAVVVVLIIIIAVAVKLCGGGKKDTDYVAMQNPVNTGGV